MFKKIITSAIFVGLSASAGAEVIGLKFTDAQGVNKEVDGGAGFINPDGNVSFVISAGLDRKINIVLRNSAGVVVNDTTSTAIHPMNSITWNGGEYYGKNLSTNFPSDDEYQLEVNIIDSDGDVVQTDLYNYVVDTTAPVISENPTYTAFSSIGQGYPYSFSSNNFGFLQVEGVGDNDQIASAKLIARPEGSSAEFSKLNAGISEDQTKITYSNYPSAIVPADGTYDLGFEVTDRAGNTTIKTIPFVVNNVIPELVFSHVYNPTTGVWDDYTPGMTVYENPTTFRLRRKKVDDFDYNGGANVGWAASATEHHQDAEYLYYNYTVNTPVSYAYRVFVTQANARRVVRQWEVDFELHSSIRIAPKKTGQSYKLDTQPSFVSNGHVYIRDPATITNFRVNVEPRTYEQQVYLSGGGGSCIVPVSQTYCDTNISLPRLTGKGRGPNTIYIRSSVGGVPDGDFNIHEGHFYVFWDFNGGEFLTTTLNSQEKTIDYTYLDQDREMSWMSNYFKTTSVKVEAIRISDMYTQEINSSSFVESSYNEYRGSVNISSLHEGYYNIYLVAKDNYDNETRKLIASSYLIDNTAPEITIKDNGLEDFDEIVGLDEIEITLSDADSADISEIILSGGPNGVTVYMSWLQQAVNIYSLEYPKIFPSLSTTDPYDITVRSVDASGNESEKTVTFIYKPTGLHQQDLIEVIATEVPLNNDVDNGFNKITHKNARTLEGQLAHGVQEAYFTLNPTSEFSVRVGGVEVLPGATEQIPVNAVQGKIDLSVYPTQTVEGTSNYLLEIFRVVSTNNFVDEDWVIHNEDGSVVSGTVTEFVNDVDPNEFNFAAVPGLMTLGDGVCREELVVPAGKTLEEIEAEFDTCMIEEDLGSLDYVEGCKQTRDVDMLLVGKTTTIQGEGLGIVTEEVNSTSTVRYYTDAERDSIEEDMIAECLADLPRTNSGWYDLGLPGTLTEARADCQYQRAPESVTVMTEGTEAVCSTALDNTVCPSVTDGRISILSNGLTCSTRPLSLGDLCRTELIDEGVIIQGFEGGMTCVEEGLSTTIEAAIASGIL